MTHASRTAPPAADDDLPVWLAAAMPGLWIRFSAEGRYLGGGGSLADPVTKLVSGYISDALPAEIAERMLGGISAAIRDGRAQIECRLVLDGGERVFEVVFVARATDEVIAFLSDATSRVAAELALADSDARLRRALDLANEGVWIIDADGLTTFATPSMAAMLGCTPEDMLGRSPREFMDEHSQVAFAERQARRRRGESEVGEFALRSLDGRDIPTTLAATPICDGDGRYIGAVAIVELRSLPE